jgi:long-chain acyl-CoA synthetase
MRSLLTMSNLFENLADVYGDREVLNLAEPLGYRLFPAAAMSYRDCLRFTNLAAEAFVRDLDLKKGDRVLLIIPDGSELLLLAVALIKAGGIAVPLDAGLPEEEMRRRAETCGASLAVVDGSVLAERSGLTESMTGIGRVMASGPRSRIPPGTISLDEAMERSSAFFLPYTLKPSNVVGLFHSEMGDGCLKAVMATNEGLVGPQLRAALLIPSRPGDLCLHAMRMGSAAGLCAALLGLCMGMHMRLTHEEEPERIMEMLEEQRSAVFMATSETYLALLQAGASGSDLSSVRLWLSSGDPLPRFVPEGFLGFSGSRQGRLSMPAAFVETYGAGGNATMIVFKPAFPFAAWPEGYPGLAVPPNRMKVVDGSGRRVKRGGEGELYIKGPAVTPGYWNDVEGTLDAKRDGWFRTRIAATKHRFLITLR